MLLKFSRGPVTNNSTIKQVLLNKHMLICIFTGFSSGLPLYILIALLPAWLRSEGVDLKAIGLFALIQLPFTWKFLWAPLFDRYIPPLGRRRGWLFISQLTLILSIPCFGLWRPQFDLWTIAYLACLIAFFSASQDIVLDAYRRRMFFHSPWIIPTNVMTNEVLATLWHPPSRSIVVPGLQRIPATKAAPPPNLPM